MARLAIALGILVFSSGLEMSKSEDLPVIHVGTIDSLWADHTDVFTAMRYALERQFNDSEQMFRFKLYADKIKTVDAYKLTRIICRQFERGIYALMGTVDPESFDTLNSYANAFEMPFVTPWFPESVYKGPKDWKQEYAIQLRPEYHEGLLELVSYYKWEKIIYIYSDFDGLLRLQRIYKNIPRSKLGSYKFQVETVKQVSSANEAIDFLVELEKVNRNSYKRVVLDCPASMAKEILLKHVRNIYLGRRNYHYLMSGLVLDDHWDTDVAEFGAVNVTGLRIVSQKSEVARKFLRTWKKLDKEKYKAAGVDGISASGALAYDAVYVLEAAFKNVLSEKPYQFRYHHGGMTCNMSSEGRQIPWKHGAAIAKSLKEVRIEGLTGFISFDENGKRTNFSFDVVEMTPGSVLTNIGTWSDAHGLQIDNRWSPKKKNRNKERGRERTYLLTSILEEPYLMLKKENMYKDVTGNDQFEGYVKDLAEMIAREIGVSFEIKIVLDGKYGSADLNQEGGWDGMIGELSRNEADIAIGPLTITAERSQVVDFSEPFMPADIAVLVKRSNMRFGGIGIVQFFVPSQ